MSASQNSVEIRVNDPKMQMYKLAVNGKDVHVARELSKYNSRGRAVYHYITLTKLAPDYNMSNGMLFKARNLSELSKKISRYPERLVIAGNGR